MAVAVDVHEHGRAEEARVFECFEAFALAAEHHRHAVIEIFRGTRFSAIADDNVDEAARATHLVEALHSDVLLQPFSPRPGGIVRVVVGGVLAVDLVVGAEVGDLGHALDNLQYFGEQRVGVCGRLDLGEQCGCWQVSPAGPHTVTTAGRQLGAKHLRLLEDPLARPQQLSQTRIRIAVIVVIVDQRIKIDIAVLTPVDRHGADSGRTGAAILGVHDHARIVELGEHRRQQRTVDRFADGLAPQNRMHLERPRRPANVGVASDDQLVVIHQHGRARVNRQCGRRLGVGLRLRLRLGDRCRLRLGDRCRLRLRNGRRRGRLRRDDWLGGDGVESIRRWREHNDLRLGCRPGADTKGDVRGGDRERSEEDRRKDQGVTSRAGHGCATPQDR